MIRIRPILDEIRYGPVSNSPLQVLSLRFVLLPGMDGMGNLFRPFQDALPEDFRVTVVSYPPDRCLEYGELLERVGEGLPDEPFVLLAEFFSGPLAIRLAAMEPANLKALVLVASFATCPAPMGVAWMRFLPLRLLFVLKPDLVVLRWLLNGREDRADFARLMSAELKRVKPDVLADRLGQVLALKVDESHGPVGVPALYLSGEQDRIVGRRALKGVKRLLPKVEVAVLNGPHLLLQLLSHEACSVILKFLSAHGIAVPGNCKGRKHSRPV